MPSCPLGIGKGGRGWGLFLEEMNAAEAEKLGESRRIENFSAMPSFNIGTLFLTYVRTGRFMKGADHVALGSLGWKYDAAEALTTV